MKKKLTNLWIFVIFSPLLVFGQVGINTESPKASFEIEKLNNGSAPDGILIPRFTVAELAAKDDSYGPDQNGVMVFITDGEDSPTGKTIQIKRPGFYYYDSMIEMWLPAGGTPQPWYSVANKQSATSNNENIYQLGQVVVGNSEIEASAQFQVSSQDKGVLLPSIPGKSLSSNVDGLMYYNPDSGCFQYYSGKAAKWLSLCGDLGMAELNFLDCDSPTGGNVTDPDNTPLIEGNNITGNPNATYTVKVNVTSPGNYTVKVSTSNGYSFYKAGNFLESGMYDIVLEGQGTPLLHNETASPDTSVDAITNVQFNNIDITPDCNLPGVHVKSSSAGIVGVGCDNITYGPGRYVANQTSFSSTQHYIDIPVSVVGSGNILLETDTQNGLKFSSGSIAVTVSTTTIRLFAQGVIGTNPGTLNYNLLNVTPSCSGSISILVNSSKGSFQDPAGRCTEILNIDPSASNGYYWIGAGALKIKTYCDMAAGGYTLIKSISEKSIFDAGANIQNESMNNYPARGLVDEENGIFNEYYFSIPSNFVTIIAAGSNNQFRFNIKEKGHQNTGTLTPEIVESTTIAPSEDMWAPNNYWNVQITGNANPLTANFSSDNYTSEGKIFGYSFNKPSSGNAIYYFNGNRFQTNPPGFYSQLNFFTGFYGARGYVANTAAGSLSYITSNSSTASFRLYDINDLFGLYMVAEPQLNHHIGTCSNSTDDYGGESFCAAGWTNWRPHRFNNGHGRILQVWVR